MVAVTLFLPDAADAQRASTAGSWRIEPSVGIWHQDDNGPATGRRIGPLIGLRLSQQRSAYTRLTASAGFHRIDDAVEYTTVDVSGNSRNDIYDKEIASLTVGAAGDLWQGDAAAVSLGFEMGVGWSRISFQRSTGDVLTGPFVQPPDEGGDWSPVFLAVPSIGLRRAMTSRVEFSTTARIMLAAGDLSPKTVPALAGGIGYRF
jgi:hypothetical protein